jgi:ankyrin repeat protein
VLQNKDTDKIRELINSGINPLVPVIPTHQTAMHMACKKDNLYVVNAILGYARRMRMSVDPIDDAGNTPMHVLA